MPVELIISIAAVMITWLIFTWLIKVIKTSIITALSIAVIVLILQLVFGIKYQELWQEVVRIPEIIWQLVNGQ
jgi:hypothetical protein